MMSIKNHLIEDITAEDFADYKEVQESGQVNMFDSRSVEMLSGLDKVQIITIMNNYDELAEKFNY